jgi:hypothetical protein
MAIPRTFPLSGRRLAFGLGFALLSASGCNHADEDGWAVSPGRYDAGPPLCATTGEAPRYPSAAHKAAFFDFTELKSHVLELGEIAVGKSTETWTTGSCELALTRDLSHWTGDSLTFASNRHFTFTPAGCTMSLEFGQGVFPVGVDYSDLFAASDSRDPEIPFIVTSTADGYLLASEHTPEMHALLQGYGCGENDQLTVALTTRAGEP